MKDKYCNRIYECRQRHHLSQKELSDILALNNRSLLSYYERGMRSINFKTLVKLSNYFKVSIDYLLMHDQYKTHTEYAIQCLGLSARSIEILTTLNNTNKANVVIANLIKKESE